MYGDLPTPQVEQVWGDGLGMFSADDLRDAVGALAFAYPDFPPTLFQFSSLCRDARRKRAQETKKLLPPEREDFRSGEVLAKIHDFMQASQKPRGDGKDWARAIMRRIELGERMPLISMQYAREVLKMPKEAA